VAKALPSYWLKLDRAKHHMREVECLVAEYEALHAYSARRVNQPRGKRHIWQYVLEITEQPPTEIALAVGDSIHNLRSALDHLAVALLPSRVTDGSFVIAMRDPFKRGPDRRYLVRNASERKRLARFLNNVPPEARALIERLQPYNESWEPWEVNILDAISRLDNRDKHRVINVVSPGVREFQVGFVERDRTHVRRSFIGHAQDGTEIFVFDERRDPPLRDSEVEVRLSGTPQVTVEIGEIAIGTFREKFWADLPRFLAELVEHVETDVLAVLEPFVRR
jgi:hypothetical protein